MMPFSKKNDTICRIFMSACLPTYVSIVLIRWTGMSFMFDTHIFFFFIGNMVPFIRLLYFIFMNSFLLSIRILWPNPRYLLKREENTSKTISNPTCALHIFIFSLLSFLVHKKRKWESNAFLVKKGKIEPFHTWSLKIIYVYCRVVCGSKKIMSNFLSRKSQEKMLKIWRMKAQQKCVEWD